MSKNKRREIFKEVFLKFMNLTDIKDLLEANLDNFHQFVGCLTDSYFVMMLVKKSKFQATEASYAPFLNSQMARGLLAGVAL